MYQALRILGLAIPIVLIAFFAYDMLDEDGEVCYVIYRSGDDGEYRDTGIVAECMFSNPGHEFVGWNTEEDRMLTPASRKEQAMTRRAKVPQSFG